MGCPISIHAPREGGDGEKPNTNNKENNISIHAPREGGDHEDKDTLRAAWKISIHAPREGGDNDADTTDELTVVFQSTPPARGATAKMHSFTCGSLTNK